MLTFGVVIGDAKAVVRKEVKMIVEGFMLLED